MDTQGWLIALWVDAADVPEWDGGREPVRQAQPDHAQLVHLWVDAVFGSKFAAWVQEATGWTLDLVSKVAGQQGLAVQPRWWPWSARLRGSSNAASWPATTRNSPSRAKPGSISPCAGSTFAD